MIKINDNIYIDPKTGIYILRNMTSTRNSYVKSIHQSPLPVEVNVGELAVMLGYQEPKTVKKEGSNAKHERLEV